MYLDFKNSRFGVLVWTLIGLYTSLVYSFVEIPRTRHVAKRKSKEPLEQGVTLIRLQAGVEAKTGLCLISRPLQQAFDQIQLGCAFVTNLIYCTCRRNHSMVQIVIRQECL